VRQVTDGAGAVVQTREWAPYGEEVGGAQSGLGYTGEWWDTGASLLYLRARWYAPGVGRFTTEDPAPGYARIPRSLHIYVYAWNNPVNLTDPAGLQIPPPTDCEPGGICYTGTYGPYTPSMVWPGVIDPLSPQQWREAKTESRQFLLPVELVAGTIATELVYDRTIEDAVGDLLLTYLLYRHFLGDCFAEQLLRMWENRIGPSGEVIGPGPGVASFHTATAKEMEAYYAEAGLGEYLPPPPDLYHRMLILLTSQGNTHYTAAYLKYLADVRKGVPAAIGSPSGALVMTSHLDDLDDLDMQVIYGAYRAGFSTYGDDFPGDYQAAAQPNAWGWQIADFLPFYRQKAAQDP